MAELGYREPVAWQRAVDLVVQVYAVTKPWPATEVYGLANQVRRAAVSIPSNIAEGHGRGRPKELRTICQSLMGRFARSKPSC